MKTTKFQQGFMLIGLGIAGAALLGLLGSTGLLALNSARAKSRDAKRLADIKQLSSALELYYNDFERYPEKLSDLEPRYIGVVPTVPTPADGPCTTETNQYFYTLKSRNKFEIKFCLGERTGGYPAGIRTLTEKGIDYNGVVLPNQNY